MKRLTLATIALSALAGSLLQTPATASPPEPGPRGRLCSYSASSDPSPEASDDAMTGQVNMGPLVTDPKGGTLHCKIRVNVNSHAGGGVAATVSCPADSNGVIVCATTVNYTSGEDDQDYMCTSYDKPGGGTIYWHPADDKGTLDPTDDEPGHWTGNPNKPCSPATQIVIDPFGDIDELVCPELAEEQGNGPNDAYHIDAEGDVWVDQDQDGSDPGSWEADWEAELIWDCPEYTFDDGNPDLNDDPDGTGPLPADGVDDDQ